MTGRWRDWQLPLSTLPERASVTGDLSVAPAAVAAAAGVSLLLGVGGGGCDGAYRTVRGRDDAALLLRAHLYRRRCVCSPVLVFVAT